MCYRGRDWYKCMRPVLLTVDDNPQVARAIERDQQHFLIIIKNPRVRNPAAYTRLISLNLGLYL